MTPPLDRRRLLLGASLGAAAWLARGSPRAHAAPGEPTPAPPPLSVLILGGTGFLGPAIVHAARARGHKITLFNRGRTNPGLFPDLETVRGDRDGGLAPLAGRAFDAVIDTSGYVPRVVDASAALLRDAVRRYLFVSTISVYPGFGTSTAPIDEDTPVGRLVDPTVERVTGETYGPLKALCEDAVRARLPDRHVVVRPGLIVGPGDPTDRFTWWPVRVARGGTIAAPGDGSSPVQFVDVRDLGAWLVRLAEDGATGTYNALGFEGDLAFVEFLHGLKCALNTRARFVWVPEDVLAAQGVAPFAALPLWLPREGLPRVSNQRARAAGLAFRPVTETAADTLAWWRKARPDGALSRRVGLAPEREAALLDAVAAR